MNEADGIDQPLEQLFQHGMAIASQLGREVSRMWQQRLEEKAKLNEREARLLQMAFDSEKRTALAVLKPTEDEKWWDQAKPADVIDAYRVANAWKEHDPAAAAAEKMIQTQSVTLSGMDKEAPTPDVKATSKVLSAEDLAREHRVDLVEATAHFEKNDKGRLEEFFEKLNDPEIARDVTAHELGLVEDWRAATGRVDPLKKEKANLAAAQAILDKAEGNQQTTVATAEYAEADREKKAAATAGFDGPNAAEEAWYRDTFLLAWPEAQENHDNSIEAVESAKQHEQVGEMATVTAGVAYNSSERQEALAARMRDAGAPEKGIEARRFAESQQKHPISHAAAGDGKTVNKVKSAAPHKSRTQPKQRGR